jgi:FMN phosphatase YigB (HAD superfamily)
LTSTLLFDLDGTLLSNPMQSFVPGYMKALSSYMAPIIDPEIFFQALMASTQRMLRNQDPDCYLKDVFDASFYPMLGIPQGTIMPALEQFYVQIFPTLKSLTSPIPEAVRVVQAAFKQNDTLAIATNPLFPLTAIEQRLDWAGLSPEEYPFSIVPSYENAHFAKPNPAFLAELLARLGWPEGPVVMVGDDPDNDVRCGLELGLPVYHVNAPPGEINPAAGVVGAGSLDDLLSWIAEQPAETLEPRFNTPSALLAILRSTPATLHAACQNLPPALWAQRRQPEEWCQTEILCHLRDVEAEVNVPRLARVIQENNPFIAGQDTDPWADQRGYIWQSGSMALAGFSATRKQLIELLVQLSPRDWQRPARHAIFGPTSLQELVSIIAGHDRLHIRQLFAFIQAASADHESSFPQ